MYLRRTQRRRKDGSTVGYVQLAHNRRVSGVTRAEVLHNLGREDQLDMGALRRLTRSIARYTDGDQGALRQRTGDDLGVMSSKAMGGAFVLDCLWRRLGIAEALRELMDRRRFAVDMERVLFALVLSRALSPQSKLAASEWATCDVHIPGLEAMDDDQAYRAMDLLYEANTGARVEEAVFFACADLLNLEVDLLFFDTTSTYFEIAEPDEGEPALRTFGHSKDHRPDLPQVVIGLAVTREGIPVRVWVWPGNTQDQSVISQVKDDLRGWRLGRAVWVVDRGFSSDENLRTLTRAGGHWIAGERMRDGAKDADRALARPGRYREVRDNLKVKEVRVDGKRFIVCHNPKEEARQREIRASHIARIEEELSCLKKRRSRARTGKAVDAHTRAECALRDHPALGRYLRQLKSGRLVVDRTKVAREERLDGKYLLSTSDPDLSAEDVALGYKNLLEAERSFRDLKGQLRLRPVFHRLSERIHAHVLLCWLALLMIRVIERRTAMTWRHVARELQRIHLVTLSGEVGDVQHTTPLTDAQRQIFDQLAIPVPSRITSLTAA